jgi:hypothetical protein
MFAATQLNSPRFLPTLVSMENLPQPPSEQTESPSRPSLPGTWPSVGATTPQRERSKRRLIVGLVVGGLILIGVISNAADDSSSERRPGYYDTGETVSSDDCVAQGGQVDGDYCYTP